MTTETVLSDDQVAAVDAMARSLVDDFGVAGLALAVVRNDQVIARGYGVKNIASGAPVDADTLFHLASISKTFVATAVMQLVEDGKVQLDAPVAAYVPEFVLADDRYRQCTVQQMLSHTAGIPDTDDYGWDRPEVDDEALARYVRSLNGEHLLSAPGERFAYSNIAYEVLGLLVARVSGQSFEEYVADNILRPLGMADEHLFQAGGAPGPRYVAAPADTGYDGERNLPLQPRPRAEQHAPRKRQRVEPVGARRSAARRTRWHDHPAAHEL